MLQINRFQKIFIGAVIITSPLADDAADGFVTEQPAGTNALQPFNDNCFMSSQVCYHLPADNEENNDDVYDSVIEIPDAKQAVFKFGKPQEKKFRI
jgi:hypothetical protein